MRHTHSFAALLLLLAGCSQSNSQATPATGATCAEAFANLDACVASFCSGNPADPICEVLQSSSTLSGASSRSCDGITQDALDHLSGASCDELIGEARLQASGKADAPCPAYFPWCNELAPKGAGYHVNVLAFNEGSAELEVLLPDISRTMEMHDGTVFQKLLLAGAGSTTEVGRPAVPTVSFLVGLPPGTDTAWVEASSVVESFVVDGVTLLPVQQSAVDDAPKPGFAYDSAYYGADVLIPATAASADPISTWRNYRVVRVTVNPLQYNPAQRRLQVASRMRLTVDFADQQSEPKDTVDDGESAYAGAYGTGLVNYPEAAASAGPKTDDSGRVRYLIIASDPLVDALQPLVDLKESQGLKTEVARLSEVGADPEKIKARIAAAYQASAIEYVLLVGDAADLPMYKYPGDPNSWESTDIPSDYWYSLLAGDDLLAEVAVGRMSAKTPEELAIHVAKTVAYEKGDVQAEWRKRVALVVHEQDYPKKYTECAESVRTRRYKPGLVDFTKVYGGENATTQQLLDVVNGGVGVVAYRGHGSETAWAEWNGEDFGGAHEGIANGAMTPVVFSFACLNLSLGYDKPTNAEQWVLRPEGGAVAFLGATQPSWTIPNHDYMRYVFQGMLDEGIVAVGPLVNRANAALLAQYGGKNDAAENVKMYGWLGDPSLEVGKTWQMKSEVRVGWCNLQWPETLVSNAGAESPAVYGQVWINGVTSAIGQGAGIDAEAGYGPAGSDPSKDGWTWVAAQYNVDSGNNDEYAAKMTVAEPGTYAYAYRFKGANDGQWLYCDLDGSQNGIDTSRLGALTVQGQGTPPGEDAGAPEEDAGAPEQDAATD